MDFIVQRALRGLSKGEVVTRQLLFFVPMIALEQGLDAKVTD